jgi:two-component system, NarL family, response regulator NreC
MTSLPVRILLIDDHKILRDGLRALLESESDIEVVGDTGQGIKGLQMAVELKPDIVVIDLGLPDISGLEAIRKIRTADSGIRTIVLSMHTQKDFILQAIEAGCDGYVPKSTAHTNLLLAIQTVHAGERFLDPKVASVLMDSYSKNLSEIELFNQLSEREQDVIKLTAQGYISREIAEVLFLSPKTVETYRQRAMEKLGLDNRPDLIRFALKAGLLQEDLES